MSGQWFYVDGRMTRIDGSHDDVIERMRELRADGHTVKQARQPKPLTPRVIARASAHRR